MKHLAFASLIAVAQAATTSINAADLPPSVPPPAPAHVLTAPYSWTGFYLGGHVGGARVEDRATAVSTNPLIITSTIDSVTSNSFIIGGQVGFNYQVGIVVLGVEADGSWTKTTVLGGSAAGPRRIGEHHAQHLVVRNRNGARWRGLG
jgi:outer membrane immunogenic protein